MFAYMKFKVPVDYYRVWIEIELRTDLYNVESICPKIGNIFTLDLVFEILRSFKRFLYSAFQEV